MATAVKSGVYIAIFNVQKMSRRRSGWESRSHGFVLKPDPELSPATESEQPQESPKDDNHEEEEPSHLASDAKTDTEHEHERTAGMSSESIVSISAAPKRPVSRKKTIKSRSRPKTPTQPRPPDEEVDAALELLIHGIPPEDFDVVTLRCCIEHLNQLKDDAVANGNYLEADEYARIVKKASKAASSGSLSSVAAQKLTYYLQKQADAQERVDEINAAWDETFEEFEDDVDIRMKNITDQQNKELEDFDQNIPTELPPKYQKHSSEYVTLRRREQMLLKNQKFVAANVVKQKADKLQQAELTDQHAKLQDDIARERNAIIDRHTKQYEAFATWLNSRRNYLVRQRDKEISGPMNRLIHYTRLVEQIEKDGIQPTPALGYSVGKVSHKETMKAVRVATQTPLQKARPKTPALNKTSLGHRPPSSMTKGSRPSTGSKSRKSSGRQRTPKLSSASRT